MNCAGLSYCRFCFCLSLLLLPLGKKNKKKNSQATTLSCFSQINVEPTVILPLYCGESTGYRVAAPALHLRFIVFILPLFTRCDSLCRRLLTLLPSSPPSPACTGTSARGKVMEIAYRFSEQSNKEATGDPQCRRGLKGPRLLQEKRMDLPWQQIRVCESVVRCQCLETLAMFKQPDRIFFFCMYLLQGFYCMWSSVTNLSPVWTPWTSWLFSCDIVGSSGDEQQPGGLKFMILLLHEKKKLNFNKDSLFLCFYCWNLK